VGCGPAQSPFHCTKCNSPPVNGQCIPVTVLLYDGSLLCGFNVAVKGIRKIAVEPANGEVCYTACQLTADVLW